MSTSTEPGAGAVRVEMANGATVVSVHGCLDGATGHTLLEHVGGAVEDATSRLDVDLREVTSFTHEGAIALRACHDLGAALAGGVHYRTAAGAGGDALLAAYDGSRGNPHPGG